MHQFDAPCGEKRVGGDEEAIRPLALHTFKSSIDLTAGVGVENFDLKAHGASSEFYLSQCRLGLGRTGRINEYCDTPNLGEQLAQEFQPLCRQLGREESNASQIPPLRLLCAPSLLLGRRKVGGTQRQLCPSSPVAWGGSGWLCLRNIRATQIE
jgi:hypothetical protein